MSILIPAVSILNPTRKWRTHADVQRTWREFGWKPTTASERKRKANFKNISVGQFLKG